MNVDSPSGEGGEVRGPSHLGPSGGRGPRTWCGDVGLQAASGDASPWAASGDASPRAASWDAILTW